MRPDHAAHFLGTPLQKWALENASPRHRGGRFAFFSAQLELISPAMASIDAKREQLVTTISSLPRCIVAMSAGVDSAVVAKAAYMALGELALAVTGRSASLPAGELEAARDLAKLIGIRHEVVDTQEFAEAAYLRNSPDRCFHCKSELYGKLQAIRQRDAEAVILNGTNADDLGDYRPGLDAARDFQVRSPLVECDIHKSEVRELAAYWNLPVWDKPAMPCLSSRIAYGEEVTPDRLAMVDSAERFLRELGLREVRVRYHKGDHARIEVPVAAIAQLCDPDCRETLVKHFRDAGFRFVSLDLAGFRSGSLNDLIPVEALLNDTPRA